MNLGPFELAIVFVVGGGVGAAIGVEDLRLAVSRDWIAAVSWPAAPVTPPEKQIALPTAVAD